MVLQLEKYEFLRKSKYYQFFRDIIVPFGFKLISKVFRNKVDDKLIVLGGYGGNLYHDNTRYLFEYLHHHTDYKVVWLSKSRKIVSDLRVKGYNAVHTLNICAIKLLRKARFIIITHGIYDILPIEFSPDTQIMLTWHGTPIKKVILDEDLKFYVYSKWGRYFKLNLRYNDYLDYILTPTSGSFEHEILSRAFDVPKSKVVALGYPKLDLLFGKEESFINAVKSKFDIPMDIDKIVLYCPTFREDHTLRLPISKQDLSQLDKLLKEINGLFLLKGHFFVQKIDFEEFKRFKVMPKEADIQELYLITDILITDYSSTMLDYSLLNRPILLFPYDLDQYLKLRGMYYELEEIAPGPIVENFDGLISAIKNIDAVERDFREKRMQIRDRFNKYTDGNSIQRILDFLGIEHT